MRKLWLQMFLWAGVACAQTAPVILNVTANLAPPPGTLTIVGQNFGSVQPTVTLGGTALTVESFTATTAVADLPAGLVLGTSYALVVTNNQAQLKATATLDVTLGPTGPAGATGPMGPQGAVQRGPLVQRARRGRPAPLALPVPWDRAEEADRRAQPDLPARQAPPAGMAPSGRPGLPERRAPQALPGPWGRTRSISPC
jgi:hypothetical protein